MASAIIETLDKYLDVKIRNLDAYNYLKDRFEYFEGFIRDPDALDFVGMIKQVITSNADRFPNAKLSVSTRDLRRDYLALKEGEKVAVLFRKSIGDGLEIRCGALNDDRVPVIHIDRFGYNRKDVDRLTMKGVEIHGYHIPKDTAAIVLKNFQKVSAKNRNAVLLTLAQSEELTGCYPKNYWVNSIKRIIEEDGNPQPGIDENAVWTLEKKGKVLSSFGNAQGYNFDHSYVSIDARVQRQDTKFEFPKEE